MQKIRGRYHPFVKDGRVSYERGGEAYEINPLNGDPLVRENSRKVMGKYILFRERGFWGG
ncbi:hypothetical protein NB640_02575 [Oxalobacter vibrioformis]|uniref:Uncharacterized protein n=1 Tax=Oxalobacter vibrioformis TaxID=933080 RepID=A0A9E9M0E5_9BURK|nr:hypothetical protein [Oxalobacter vibrioformis]WAW10563.1 hypothetical protein NB640_02575 [Oxalobacter vibrioformis]